MPKCKQCGKALSLWKENLFGASCDDCKKAPKPPPPVITPPIIREWNIEFVRRRRRLWLILFFVDLGGQILMYTAGSWGTKIFAALAHLVCVIISASLYDAALRVLKPSDYSVGTILAPLL